MNIVLIGMRGSGKSTIGKKLANKLNRQYYEIDSLIEKHEKKQISEIVRESGWNYFRDVEKTVVQSLSGIEDSVIATGGGTVENIKNVSILRNNGILIYLKANIKTLLNRIINKPTRPYLTKAKTMKEDIKSVYIKRKNIYEESAHFAINTSTKTPTEIINEIITIINHVSDLIH